MAASITLAVDSAFGISTAAAQKKPTLEETYKDIESVYSVTREYMKVCPKQGIAASLG